MLDVQPVDREQIKRHHQDQLAGVVMADEPEDPDGAADRLEAALERIALLAATKPAPQAAAVAEPSEAGDADMSIAEIAERLDALIARLRAALDDDEKSN